MNKVNLSGRICKDLKLQGEVLKFSIAITRKFKNKDGQYDSDFINCVAFGKTAEMIEKFFEKGKPIEISGTIMTGKYEGKNGTVYSTEVKVDEWGFVLGAPSGNTNNSNDEPLGDPVDNGDLPF